LFCMGVKIFSHPDGRICIWGCSRAGFYG